MTIKNRVERLQQTVSRKKNGEPSEMSLYIDAAGGHWYRDGDGLPFDKATNCIQILVEHGRDNHDRQKPN